MTDSRSEQPGQQPDLEHDEYHSSLELDDTTGWRVFIVPGILVVLLIGAISFFFLYSGDVAPDPRVQAHLQAKQAEQERRVRQLPAPSEATTQAEPAQPAAEATENAAGQ